MLAEVVQFAIRFLVQFKYSYVLKEINAVVQKARAKSAPSPNGVPYLLCKRCPNVLKRSHKILRGGWSNLKISEQWMSADGVYITKEQNSTEINQFQPMSLLNVEGKIIFSVMASLLTKCLTENGYINTSVQKGGIPGVSGCLEHGTSTSFGWTWQMLTYRHHTK